MRVVCAFAFFNGIAYVERLTRVYMVEIAAEVEGNAIEHLARSVVDQFEFDVFQMFANQFAGAVIYYAACAEYRFRIARSESIEFT